MSHHEKQWLTECPRHFSFVFYNRYVDDTFVLFNDKSHAQLFLDYINSKHNNIKFTMECEVNNSISFLDASIKRVDNKFDISVHRKPTFSGLGTSFFSFCSIRFKINSIHSLLHRAYNISSDYLNLHNEFQFLISFFNKNGFSINLIRNNISKFLKSKYICNNNTNTNNDHNLQQLYFSFPFFGSQSEKLKKELGNLLHKYFPSIKFNIILVNNSKIGNFFNYKDKLDTSMESSLVYKFSCGRCSSEYVGCSRRALCVRVSEHRGISFRTGHSLTSPPHSNIRHHVSECHSNISINNFKIIDRCSNNTDLFILESLHIFKRKPTLNNSLSSYPLYLVNK